MKPQLLALILAAVIGTLSFIGVQVYVESVRDSATKSQQTVKVYALSREIPAGSRVRRDDLKEVEIPRSAQQMLSDEVITESEWPKYNDKRSLLRRVGEGQLLLASHFAPDEDWIEDNEEIEPSRAAYSLDVPTTSLHGGQLRPGSKVDVVATYSLAGAEGTTRVSRTVLTNVVVRAVNGVSDSARRPSTASSGAGNLVTLILTPEQCQGLELLRSSGSQLALMLRNRNNASPTGRDVISLDEFIRAEPSVKDPFTKQ